ncbi:hypothetical protein M3O75_28495 [Klebsiella pneumoniae]|nr:hypothetical protein [Klebsiella pneumoniae]
MFLLQPQHIPWQVAEVAEACVQPAHWSADVDTWRRWWSKPPTRATISGDEQRRLRRYSSEAAG